MAQFFGNLLTASFHGSIVILAVIVLRLLLKNTPKKFFCMLWLLAGIRLLMPFEIQSTLSLQPNPEPMFQQVAEYEVPDFAPVAPITPIQQENRQLLQTLHGGGLLQADEGHGRGYCIQPCGLPPDEPSRG